MAILKRIDDWSEAAKLSDFCFLCHEPLTFPTVFWHGASPDSPAPDGTELWLHAKCAKGFAARLMRDAKELEQGKQAAEWLQSWKQKNERGA